MSYHTNEYLMQPPCGTGSTLALTVRILAPILVVGAALAVAGLRQTRN